MKRWHDGEQHLDRNDFLAFSAANLTHTKWSSTTLWSKNAIKIQWRLYMQLFSRPIYDLMNNRVQHTAVSMMCRLQFLHVPRIDIWWLHCHPYGKLIYISHMIVCFLMSNMWLPVKKWGKVHCNMAQHHTCCIIMINKTTCPTYQKIRHSYSVLCNSYIS